MAHRLMLSHAEFLQARSEESIRYRIMSSDSISWTIHRGKVRDRLEVLGLCALTLAFIALSILSFDREPRYVGFALLGILLGLSPMRRFFMVVSFVAWLFAHMLDSFATATLIPRLVSANDLFCVVVFAACVSLQAFLLDKARKCFRERILSDATVYEEAIQSGSLMLIPIETGR